MGRTEDLFRQIAGAVADPNTPRISAEEERAGVYDKVTVTHDMFEPRPPMAPEGMDVPSQEVSANGLPLLNGHTLMSTVEVAEALGVTVQAALDALRRAGISQLSATDLRGLNIPMFIRANGLYRRVDALRVIDSFSRARV